MRDIPFEQQLAWAETQMPVTRAAAERLPDLSHVRSKNICQVVSPTMCRLCSPSLMGRSSQ